MRRLFIRTMATMSGLKTRGPLHCLLVLVAVTTLTTALHAQNTINFSSDQGLSNTCVRSIYQDNHRNVWISTRNGANRFDGHKMNAYYHDSDDPYSLLTNTSLEFLDFDKDNVLVATTAGLQLYNYATDKFYSVPLIIDKDTVERSITSLYRFKDGVIHVCVANRGSFIIDYDGSKNDKPLEERGICARYTEDYFINGFSPRTILEDSHSQLWILNNHHEIYVRDKGVNTHIDGLTNVTAICEGVRGVYAGTSDGKLIRLNSQTHQFEVVQTGIKSIASIYPDNHGLVFICTDGFGLKLYNELTNDLSQSKIRTPEYDLSTSNVKSVMIDNRHNMWIGVYWKGIVVQPITTSAFQYIGRRSALFNVIGTNCVTALCQAKDDWTWVATDHGGLYHLPPNRMTSEHWAPEEISDTPSTITAIYDDGNGTVWLGMSLGGLVKFNTATRTFTTVGNGINSAYSIVKGNGPSLWIGTMGDGVFSFNPTTGSTVHYVPVYDDGTSGIPLIHNSYIYGMSIIGGKLYVGSSDGLDVFAVGADEKPKFLYRCLELTSVNCIRSDSHGHIWCATSKGLYTYTEKNGKIVGKSQLYTTKQGLPDDMVNAIEIVGSNRGNKYQLWLSTDNGLALFDPDTEVFTNFYSNDGLQGNEFSRAVSLQASGRLYFGGINGITAFNPSDIISSNNEHLPTDTLRIIDFYVNGKSVHAGQKSGRYTMFDGWISDVERIDLCSDDNSFTIELSTMNIEPLHITYEYKINDGDWITSIDESGRISFNRLSPGTYDISIRAISYNQKTPERNIRIVVHQPWYNSRWAWIVYIILAVLLGRLIIYQYIERRKAKRILESHRQSEAINEMRMQFFMNISHEIRTPMTLIMAPLDRLKKMGDDEQHQKNYQLIHQNANRIMQLINQLMDVRKIEKGQFQLHYKRVELVSFLKGLHELFQETARTKSIDFQFVHEGITSMPVCIDESNFDKIIMNLLSNAFKFTPDSGKITLSLEDNIGATTSEPKFIIKVTDTGVGIPDDKKAHIFDRFYQVSGAKNGAQPNQGGTGIGLNLASLLTGLHDGTLEVADNPEQQGTQFILTMPQANYLIEEEEASETVEANEADNEGEDNSPIEDDNTESNEEGKSSTGKTTASTILVIDDESAIREYIAEDLTARMPKYNIEQFSNGRTAWEFLQRHPSEVAVVVSDIMMPEMDGSQLCRNLKQSFLTNHIPIILLTAKVTEQEKIEGLDIGADAYITKPFSIDLVLTTVTNLIGNRRRLLSKYENMVQEEQGIDQINITSPDEQLMQRVMKIINANLQNPELNVEFIAREVGLSRVHFHRKLKELTNETPRDFIRGIRLRQAARLLSEKNLDISHVADACGFRSISTFSTTFKSVYGVSPKDYGKE